MNNSMIIILCMALSYGYTEGASLRAAATPEPKYMDNIQVLFKGYDILYGNPMPTGFIPMDPGLRKQIFGAVYDPNHPEWVSGDKLYYQPKGTTISSCAGSCVSTFSSTRIAGTKSYSASLSTKVSAEGEGWGAKFSASTDYKNVKDGSSARDSFFTQSEMSCCIYYADIDYYTPPDLSDDFKEGLKTLTETYMKEPYLHFIKTFGTHYVSQITMGAMFGQQSEITADAWSAMESSGLNIETAANYSGALVAGSASATSDSQKKHAETFNKYSTKQRMYSLGAKPPSDGKTSTWAEQAVESPAPLKYNLVQIDELVKDEAIKANLKKALKDYCHNLMIEGLIDSCDGPGEDKPYPKIIKKRTWTKWGTENFNGGENSVHECPEGHFIKELKFKEQNGYGLVNLHGKCSDGKTEFDATSNFSGGWNSKITCSEGFRQVTPRYQDGYGVINAKSFCVDDALQSTSNGNMKGNWKFDLKCNEGQQVVGFQTRDQWGYGIVNLRYECA